MLLVSKLGSGSFKHVLFLYRRTLERMKLNSGEIIKEDHIAQKDAEGREVVSASLKPRLKVLQKSEV